MRFLVVLVLSILGALLLGCIHIPQPRSDVRQIGNISVELWASTDNPQLGQTVKIRASVSNLGSTPFTIELKDQPVLDIIVGFGTKTEQILARWSDGKPITSDLARLELKPGEIKTIEMDWVVDQRAYAQPVGVRANFTYNLKCPECFVPPGFVIPVGPYNR